LRTDLKETCVQVSRHGAKPTTLLHQPKVGSGNRKEELDEFHDQLDHILLNGDEEVTYSRFQDPFPLYDSTVKPTTTSTRRALNHVVPADELLLNSNSRSRNKKMAAADLYGTRRQSLRFDSLTSGSSNCTSSSSKNTSHLVRRTRGDVFENKRGEVSRFAIFFILRRDFQTAYKMVFGFFFKFFFKFFFFKFQFS
jgi:hypothetical protein